MPRPEPGQIMQSLCARSAIVPALARPPADRLSLPRNRGGVAGHAPVRISPTDARNRRTHAPTDDDDAFRKLRVPNKRKAAICGSGELRTARRHEKSAAAVFCTHTHFRPQGPGPEPAWWSAPSAVRAVPASFSEGRCQVVPLRGLDGANLEEEAQAHVARGLVTGRGSSPLLVRFLVHLHITSCTLQDPHPHPQRLLSPIRLLSPPIRLRAALCAVPCRDEAGA